MRLFHATGNFRNSSNMYCIKYSAYKMTVIKKEYERLDHRVIDSAVTQWRQRLDPCFSANSGHQTFVVKRNCWTFSAVTWTYVFALMFCSPFVITILAENVYSTCYITTSNVFCALLRILTKFILSMLLRYGVRSSAHAGALGYEAFPATPITSHVTPSADSIGGFRVKSWSG